MTRQLSLAAQPIYPPGFAGHQSLPTKVLLARGGRGWGCEEAVVCDRKRRAHGTASCSRAGSRTSPHPGGSGVATHVNSVERRLAAWQGGERRHGCQLCCTRALGGAPASVSPSVGQGHRFLLKDLGCRAQMRQGGNSHRQLMDSSQMTLLQPGQLYGATLPKGKAHRGPVFISC